MSKFPLKIRALRERDLNFGAYPSATDGAVPGPPALCINPEDD
jgi:hypothetical protein